MMMVMMMTTAAVATWCLSVLSPVLSTSEPSRGSRRHAVYWNSSNLLLRREGYTVQVSVNDYLDIYCPHYNSSLRGAMERNVAEQYVLYMVGYDGYLACDPRLGFKRWECKRPHAPHVPIKFSEKFQRYSAFSLGYEFTVGQEYYYISAPTHRHRHGHGCLRMRVYVCCSPASHSDDDSARTSGASAVRPSVKIRDVDEFNPKVPKLEKSVSGSSPSRDRLLLTVAAMLLASAPPLS
ncbi:ephrin-A3-like [Hippocampus zosterae]|uniref:ephrin-A3-like n=1 Tax=Hippocampus zosterae TaxID=109293 RepID=UPI00223C9D76|nr:ephrin-A3-like [Hippocampus zosterae]